MKILHIVASVATEASGPSYSVQRLSEILAGEGSVSSTATTGVMSRSQRNKTPHSRASVTVYPIDRIGGPLARAWCYSTALRSAIEAAARANAVLHSHGLWLAPNLYPAAAAAKWGNIHIVSPRGMMAREALAFSPIRKKLMWILAQRRALEGASCLHATSEAEAAEIRALGLRRPIAILPNGIDLPVLPARSFSAEGTRTVLHLGRIHPKKGIDQLIAAWSSVTAEYPHWRLRIVGPDENGHLQALQRQVAQLGLRSVIFDEPLFGVEKLAAYRQADLFVLPTRNENFGLVVAEALAAETPVICTKGAPWAGLDENGCGWWIPYGARPLAAALRVALGMPQHTLHAMGERGRAWMARDFGWPTIGERMRAVYRWAQSGETRPSCVVDI